MKVLIGRFLDLTRRSQLGDAPSRRTTQVAIVKAVSMTGSATYPLLKYLQVLSSIVNVISKPNCIHHILSQLGNMIEE